MCQSHARKRRDPLSTCQLDLMPELKVPRSVPLRRYLAEALGGYRAVRRIGLGRIKQVTALRPKLNVELAVGH